MSAAAHGNMTGFGKPNVVHRNSPWGRVLTMYYQRQTGHLDELYLLRNYASGQLRQELDDEIEGLRHQAGVLSDGEWVIDGIPRVSTSHRTKCASTVSMT